MQMTVEKPKVQADSYRGDAGREKMSFTTGRNFRFMSTVEERVNEAVVRNAIMDGSPNRKTLTMETDV